MWKLLSKHFELCFLKLKCSTLPLPLPLPHAHSPQHEHYKYKCKHASLYDVVSDSDDTWWQMLPPPDLATVISSHRFFFSSPGRSNSITDYTRTHPCSNKRTLIPNGGVGVTKNSLDPYIDFRRSMQEMIDSRDDLVDVTRDWEYLNQLLLCYLALNHHHNHNYILRAFTDLVLHLLSSQGTSLN